MSTHEQKPPQPRRTGRLRGLVFRLLAVALSLGVLVLVEGALWLVDLGRPSYAADPFAGFRGVRPLFVLSEDGTRYETSPARLEFFRRDSFAARKAKNEFRIFVLGGSTVQGRPFSIDTSMTRWLELSLAEADPSRRFEVVNCGGISYASYRLVPILEEVLGYQPDLVIVYAGHNEFLEDREYRHIKRLPAVVAVPSSWIARTRSFTLLSEAYAGLRGRTETPGADGRPLLPAEVQAMLDYRGGLEKYHRDEKWRRDVIAHFEYNLRRMVETARRSRVPLWLVNPVCNLRDCPPLKSEHRDGLTAEELGRWQSLVAEAAEAEPSDLRRAADLLKQATDIDDQYAGTFYNLARCYDGLGMMDEAKAAYLKAKELDVCPLRILEAENEAILRVGRETGTPVVDVRALFEAQCEAGIPGGFLLLDHVHPSIRGHQVIAAALAEAMARAGIVEPPADWKSREQARFREHLASLDSLYFEQGEQRLERLRLWTQGRSQREPPE